MNMKERKNSDTPVFKGTIEADVLKKLINMKDIFIKGNLAMSRFILSNINIPEMSLEIYANARKRNVFLK